MSQKEMRRCPGCGDRGDIDHITACCADLNNRWFREVAMQAYASWHAGKSVMIEMLTKQLRRKSTIDIRALQRGSEHRSRNHVGRIRRRYG